MTRAMPHLETVLHATTAAELEHQWQALHPRERAAFSPRAREIRRRDYVAGRRAAAMAAKAIALPPSVFVLGRTMAPRMGQPEVWREHDGRTTRVEGVSISISHAATQAVAAVHTRTVGIDLVDVKAFQAGSATVENASVDVFGTEVFVAGEWERWCRALRGATDAEVTAVAFAAKEAALKIIGEGLRIPLLEVEVQPRAALDDTGVSSAVVGRHREQTQAFAMRVTSSGSLRQVLLWEPALDAPA